MTPCFICSSPANAIRSITMLTSPPASSKDAVIVCPQCVDSLDFALIQILTLDVATESPLTIPTDLSFTRHPGTHQL